MKVTSLSWVVAIAVGTPAAAAPADGEPELDGLSPGARREYEEEYLTVEDQIVVIRGDSRRVQTVYQGKDRQPIRDDDFFRLVGRPEQADFYDHQGKREAGLVAGGMVALIAGGVIAGQALVAESCHEEVTSPRFADCVRQNAYRDRSPPFLATTLVLGGLGMMVSVLVTHQRPPPPDEIRRLANEYNRRLRERLGATSRPVGAPVKIQAAPYAGPHAGGLLLRASF